MRFQAERWLRNAVNKGWTQVGKGTQITLLQLATHEVLHVWERQGWTTWLSEMSQGIAFLIAAC